MSNLLASRGITTEGYCRFEQIILSLNGRTLMKLNVDRDHLLSLRVGQVGAVEKVTDLINQLQWAVDALDDVRVL